MVVTKHLSQFLDGSIGEFLGECRADDAREIGLCDDTLHDGGVGGNDDVVLVHTPRVVTLRLQYTDDTHGDTLETDGLANGIMTVEQLLDDGGTNDADLGGLADVFLSEAVAFFDGPLLDVEVVDGFAVHRGVGIVVAVDGLTGGSNLRRHLGHKFLLAHDAFVVGHLQCLHG